ncbi:MAG TPA: hypothetical protein VMS93_07615 [Candidatus Saccharimonadales bacterium]|nr:hypothetical protein [Candidatus Saccharimonadales bacterium]
MPRSSDPRRHATASMWEAVKSGEWQYGKGLALAWAGEWMQAHVEFQAAADRFRLRGANEMLLRVSLHRDILECRCDPDSENRLQRAARLMMRLSQVKQIESYRPPFKLETGPRLAQCFWKDIANPEFLLPGVVDTQLEDEMAG